MIPFNLETKKEEILKVGTELFDHIMSIPKDIRPDDNNRPGINVRFDIPGTIKILHVPIKEPFMLAHDFSVEKSVRTELFHNVTSQDSEQPEKFRFRGCITFEIDAEGNILHCSVSGLFGSEDVVIAIILMAIMTDHTVSQVIANIQRRGGKLPEEIFQEDHYLKKLLDMYR